MAEVVDNPPPAPEQLTREEWERKQGEFRDMVSLGFIAVGATLTTVGLAFWVAWYVGISFLGAVIIALGILLGFDSKDSSSPD